MCGWQVCIKKEVPPPPFAQAPPLRKHHYPVKPSFLEPCPVLPIQILPIVQAPLPGETVVFCAFGGACAKGGGLSWKISTKAQFSISATHVSKQRCA